MVFSTGMQQNKAIRIFISSPGDVSTERLRAAVVVRRLKREFQRFFDITAVLWEFETMLANGHFQDIIDRPSECDLFVMVLWSRMGTALPEDRYHGADGRTPVTGTEWEFEDALSAFEQRGAPDLIVYRKTAPPDPKFADNRDLRQKLRDLERQLELLEQFWERYFETRDGRPKRAFNTFDPADEFETKLEAALRDLLRKRADPGLARAGFWHAGSPFRGLSVFEAEHTHIFFGRALAEREVIEGWTRIAEAGRAFLLVLGASGIGKSSLVQAGVLPTLTQPGVTQGVSLWRMARFRPGLETGQNLFLRLAEVLIEPPGALPELGRLGVSLETLAQQLREAPSMAVHTLGLGLKYAHDKNASDPGDARLILFVDQFEELFTLAAPSDQEGFVTILAAMAGSGFIWVIATMRSDFYARLADLPNLRELASSERQYLLPAPRLGEIGQMIREPAAVAAISFEKNDAGIGLDDVLQEAAAREPGALPLLEFALDELYRIDIEEQRKNQLTFASYIALGNFAGAIAARAEAVCAALGESEQAAVGSVLLALVTVGDGSLHDAPIGPTARMVPRQEMLTTAERAAVLEQLISARLVIAIGDTVRVAHEALIAHWPRLQNLVRENAAMIELRDRLLRDRLLWERQGGSPDFLIPPGARLREAEGLLHSHSEHLDPSTLAFIERSRDADLQTHEREVFRQRLNSAGQKLLEFADAPHPIDGHGALAREEATRELVMAVLAASPNKRLWQTRLCVAEQTLGDAYRVAGKREPAIAVYRAAVKGGEALLTADPDDPVLLRQVCEGLSRLADMLPEAEAKPVLRRALELGRRHAQLQQDDIEAEHELAAIEARCRVLGIAAPAAEL